MFSIRGRQDGWALFYFYIFIFTIQISACGQKVNFLLWRDKKKNGCAKQKSEKKKKNQSTIVWVRERLHLVRGAVGGTAGPKTSY